MQLSRGRKPFTPVTLTISTAEEWSAIWHALANAYEKFTGTCPDKYRGLVTPPQRYELELVWKEFYKFTIEGRS